MANDLKKAGGPTPPKPAPVPKTPMMKPPTTPPSNPRPPIMTPPNRSPKVTVSMSTQGGLAKSDTFESLLASTTHAHKGAFHDPVQNEKDSKLENFLENRLKSHFSGKAVLQKDEEEPGEPMRRQRVEHSAQKKLSDYTPPPAKAPRNGPVPKTPNYKLLTPMESNAKTAKNEGVEGDEGQGHFSGILHLAPATLAGVGNVCEAATPGCRDACLNTAGRGGMFKTGEDSNVIQDARVRKTRALAENPGKFMDDLIHDVGQVRRHAQARGDKPVVRLNGTSDIAWEDLKLPQFGGKNIFEAHPDVQFYDYTKRPDRVMKNKHPNYHLTFSNSGKNEGISKRLLSAGHNVAAVFGGKRLPTQWNGHKVISGDEHDLRFLDERGGNGKPGVVVGLKAKGDAKGDKTGFVVWNHEGNKEGVGPKDLKQIKREQVTNFLASGKKRGAPEPTEKSLPMAGATGAAALKKDASMADMGASPGTQRMAKSERLMKFMGCMGKGLKKDDDSTPTQKMATSVKNAFGGGAPTPPPAPTPPAPTGGLAGAITGGLNRMMGKCDESMKPSLKKDMGATGMNPTMNQTSQPPQLDPGGVAAMKNAFGKSEGRKSKNPAAEWHTPANGPEGLEKSGKWPVPGIVPPSGDKSHLHKHVNSVPDKKLDSCVKKVQAKGHDAQSSYAICTSSLKKELVTDGFVPKPTGQKALDMIKGALDKRAKNKVAGSNMSHEEMKELTNKLKGPNGDMNKSQYAKTEPVEVREGKKAADKKSDDQKARINQQLKTETLDYVANKNGARYEGLGSDSARKTRRDVKDDAAGSVTNPPKV